MSDPPSRSGPSEPIANVLELAKLLADRNVLTAIGSRIVRERLHAVVLGERMPHGDNWKDTWSDSNGWGSDGWENNWSGDSWSDSWPDNWRDSWPDNWSGDNWNNSWTGDGWNDAWSDTNGWGADSWVNAWSADSWNDAWSGDSWKDTWVNNWADGLLPKRPEGLPPPRGGPFGPYPRGAGFDRFTDEEIVVLRKLGYRVPEKSGRKRRREPPADR